jgi:hypothetical protein
MFININKYFKQENMQCRYEGNAFVTSLDAFKGKVGDPIGEGVKAAESILQSVGQPVHLALSGGLNSLFLATCFYQAKARVDVDILQLSEGINKLDVNASIATCDRFGFPYKIHKLDVKKFFYSGEYLKYGETYSNISPEVSMMLFLFQQVNQPIVSGSSFILPTQVGSKYYWAGLPNFNSYGLYQYFNIKNQKGFPFFNQLTGH